MAKVIPLFNTEYELAQALSKKDTRAYHWFYEQYAAKLLAICCRYISDRMAAEDVMLDGIMKIFERVSSFSYVGSFEGWCKRLIVNEALSYLRKNKRHEFNLTENENVGPIVTNQADLETEELLSLISELPLGFRTVFNLFAIEGYSHAEIAEKLGITEGTSKSQLSRARLILQEKLKKLNNFRNDGKA